jgi:hypothetical protein
MNLLTPVQRPGDVSRPGKEATDMSASIPVTRLLATVALFVLPLATSAAVLRVPADYPSIPTAIAAANPGDTVLVSPGTYPGPILFQAKDITLRSTGGPGATTLIGTGSQVVTIGPRGALVGFTIRNGEAQDGAGTMVQGPGSLIEGNVYEFNRQTSGGWGAAIGGNSASPLIVRNLFRNNSCDEQFLSGVISFINDSEPRIENNVFDSNPCRAINLTLPAGTDVFVLNNTMVRNRAGVRDDARVDTETHVYRNNLIAYNTVGLQVEFGDPTTYPTWEHNLVFGNGTDYLDIPDQTGMNGNISENPRFASFAGRDLRLASVSPAIDAGSAAEAPFEDTDGNARPVDGDGDLVPKHDMGAYEFDPALWVVGGATLGLRLNAVVCKNQTTGEQITLETGGAPGWDCEAAGLTVNPGDVVTMTPAGIAN